MALQKMTTADGRNTYVPKNAINNPEYKITVEDLDEMVDMVFTVRTEYEEAKAESARMYNELEALKFQVTTYLKALDREDYKSGAGTVKAETRMRVKNPQTPEDKAKLNNFLKERDLFEQYVSVNNQTLNAFFKAEYNEAVKRGEGMTYKMPGVPDPVFSEELRVTKNRKSKGE